MSDDPKTEVIDKAQPLDLTKAYASDSARTLRMERMLAIEDEILEHSLGIVRGMLSAAEIRPSDENPPEEWVQRLGKEAAEQQLAVARECWLPASKMPGFVVHSTHLVVGIAKARGQKIHLRAGELNVKISLPAPTTAEHPGEVVYETREIEE